MPSTTSPSVEGSDSKRLGAWRDLICQTYVPVRCGRLGDRPFAARLETRKLGASEISRIESSAMTYARHADDIRADTCDDLQLCLITEGRAHIRQQGREATLGRGDMGLYDAAHPFDLMFPEDYQAVVVKLPRALLASRLPDPVRLTARLLPGDVRLGALAASMIREAARIEDAGSEQVSQRLSTSLAEILALALEAELLGAEPLTGRHAQLLQRVKAYIQAHLDDPELDVPTIAAAHHVAPRTLNRLFAADGCTAMRWLWQQRLEASYAALAEGRVVRVTDAALNYGFKDFSHFTRGFKKAFGILPNSLIRAPH